MKKIKIILIALAAVLLVGCASTPKEEPFENISYSKTDENIEIYTGLNTEVFLAINYLSGGFTSRFGESEYIKELESHYKNSLALSKYNSDLTTIASIANENLTNFESKIFVPQKLLSNKNRILKSARDFCNNSSYFREDLNCCAYPFRDFYSNKLDMLTDEVDFLYEQNKKYNFAKCIQDYYDNDKETMKIIVTGTINGGGLCIRRSVTINGNIQSAYTLYIDYSCKNLDTIIHEYSHVYNHKYTDQLRSKYISISNEIWKKMMKNNECIQQMIPDGKNFFEEYTNRGATGAIMMKMYNANQMKKYFKWQENKGFYVRDLTNYLYENGADSMMKFDFNKQLKKDYGI